MQAVTTIAPAEPRDPFFALVERAASDPAFDPDKIDKLLVMWERTKAQAAEAEFNDAMSRAQSEMEPIRRDSSNPQTHSKYASYAAIDLAVREIYTRHGFCLSFNTEDMPGVQEVRVVCLVSRGGYTRRYQVEVPTDGKGMKDNVMMTATHAMGSGITYGRRYLKTMIFDLSTKDDDGNAAGGKSYMGPPVTNRQEAAERSFGGTTPVPPRPSDLTIKIGPNSNTRFVDFTMFYVEAMGKVKTTAEMQALMDANAVNLSAIRASTVEAAEPLKKRLADVTAEARKRVAEATSSGPTTKGAPPFDAQAPAAASPSTAPKHSTTSASTGAPTASPSKPAATISNPEAFLKEMFLRMDQAGSIEALDLVWERDISTMEMQLMPPDMDTLYQRYRRCKGALEP